MIAGTRGGGGDPPPRAAWSACDNAPRHYIIAGQSRNVEPPCGEVFDQFERKWTAGLPLTFERFERLYTG